MLSLSIYPIGTLHSQHQLQHSFGLAPRRSDRLLLVCSLPHLFIMATATPRYQTPASRRRQPLHSQPPPQQPHKFTLTSTPSPPPQAARFPRSHSNPILPSPAPSAVTLPSAWCHPPADIAAHICQHLPLPSLLLLSTLSHYYNLVLSHPHAFRLPCLSLSLHHSLHSFLASLLPPQHSSSNRSSRAVRRRHRPHSIFSHLQHVDISHSLYSASSLAFLTHCTALRTLRLHQSQYDPDNLTRLTTALTASPHLHSLQLSSVRVSNHWMTAVGQLSSLTCLDLHGTMGYDGKALAQLRPLQALKVLNLEGSECVDDEAIHALLGPADECGEATTVDGSGVFGGLSVLRLSSGVTDASLRLLAVECRQLTSLSLTGCRFITMSGVTALAESLHSLTSLGLSRCPLLFPLPVATPPTAASSSSTAAPSTQPSPVSPSPSPSTFPHFPSLSLLTLSFITDSHLTQLLSTHPHLSHLALSSHSLTSACFPALLSHSPLTELGLSLWGRGRRDLLFSRRIRDIVRRWGKELRGGMVMVEGGGAVSGMVAEVVEGMKRAAEGEWMEEKEEEEVDEWRWTQSGRLKPHLGQWL